MRPLRWWAESAPPGADRVKLSENLGATSVAPVAPVDTSLYYIFVHPDNSILSTFPPSFVVCAIISILLVSLLFLKQQTFIARPIYSRSKLQFQRMF